MARIQTPLQDHAGPKCLYKSLKIKARRLDGPDHLVQLSIVSSERLPVTSVSATTRVAATPAEGVSTTAAEAVSTAAAEAVAATAAAPRRRNAAAAKSAEPAAAGSCTPERLGRLVRPQSARRLIASRESLRRSTAITAEPALPRRTAEALRALSRCGASLIATARLAKRVPHAAACIGPAARGMTGEAVPHT